MTDGEYKDALRAATRGRTSDEDWDMIQAVASATERHVRATVVRDLEAKAARDWPGIGDFLADIVCVVRGGVDVEPQ
ncbi:hypothetical protein ACWCO0_09505 [Streptomyces tubercidicus]